jgi:hypothetical protein
MKKADLPLSNIVSTLTKTADKCSQGDLQPAPLREKMELTHLASLRAVCV